MASPFEPERNALDAEPAAETQARRRKTREAMTWLRDYLHGPMPADAIITEAARLGIARTTLQTAKERLHIRSVRHAAGWTWYPPKSRKKPPVEVG
jgi:hypothetical protein